MDLGALRAELSLLSVKNLRERAATAGVDAGALEKARDAHDPVQAITELILASTATASPAPDPAVLCTQLELVLWSRVYTQVGREQGPDSDACATRVCSCLAHSAGRRRAATPHGARRG